MNFSTQKIGIKREFHYFFLIFLKTNIYFKYVMPMGRYSKPIKFTFLILLVNTHHSSKVVP